MKKFNIIALLNCKFFEKNGYFLLSYFKIYRLSVFFMYSSMFKGICLRDIRRVDKPGKKFRFGLTYIWHNLYFNFYIRRKIQCKEFMLVPSIATIFFNAGVLEREVWERFGISFFEHPELKRLLTDFSFKGYPLRKDFPLVGFTEVFYSDTNKKLQEVAVEIMQNYRIFSRAQEWSGTITRNGGVNNYVLKVENSRFTFFDEEGCVTTRFFLETLETNLIKIRYDFGF